MLPACTPRTWPARSRGCLLPAFRRSTLPAATTTRSRASRRFSRLVYPVAETGGLGIHVTLDLAGTARFGPDVQWLNAIDYSFNPDTRDKFVAAIRRYYPAPG